ncbi:hypothetical protein ABH926_006689 [Catenulispora sp. GP43]
MQQREVAVAEDRLGIGPDRLDIDQVEVADHRLTAVTGDDRPHLGITQQSIELPGDLRRSGSAPPTAPSYLQQRSPAHTEPHPSVRARPPPARHWARIRPAAGRTVLRRPPGPRVSEHVVEAHGAMRNQSSRQSRWPTGQGHLTLNGVPIRATYEAKNLGRRMKVVASGPRKETPTASRSGHLHAEPPPTLRPPPAARRPPPAARRPPPAARRPPPTCAHRPSPAYAARRPRMLPPAACCLPPAAPGPAAACCRAYAAPPLRPRVESKRPPNLPHAQHAVQQRGQPPDLARRQGTGQRRERLGDLGGADRGQLRALCRQLHVHGPAVQRVR